jgi:hypothetical protein
VNCYRCFLQLQFKLQLRFFNYKSSRNKKNSLLWNCTPIFRYILTIGLLFVGHFFPPYEFAEGTGDTSPRWSFVIRKCPLPPSPWRIQHMASSSFNAHHVPSLHAGRRNSPQTLSLSHLLPYLPRKSLAQPKRTTMEHCLHPLTAVLMRTSLSHYYLRHYKM